MKIKYFFRQLGKSCIFSCYLLSPHSCQRQRRHPPGQCACCVRGRGAGALFLVGVGGTNTDSWSRSFAPRLELEAPRRVAQHPAGYRGGPICCGKACSLSNTTSKRDHPILNSTHLLLPVTQPGHASCQLFHNQVSKLCVKMQMFWPG